MIRLFSILTLINGIYSTCTCDTVNISPYNHLHNSKSKEFHKTNIKGYDYHRPKPDRSIYRKAHHRKLNTDTTECNSEQIHITLGGNLDEVIISYTSSNFNSYVDYSTDANSLITSRTTSTTSSNVIHVNGTYRVHSELYYVNNNLVYPSMGEPTETAEAVRVLEDTSPWAYEQTTKEKWYNWYNVTKMQTGFGRYNNPYMIYTSPVIHTVTLSGLKSGTNYSYMVADSCQIHSFIMPKYYYGSTTPINLYPFKLGLTGDVGQTDVSLESMAALAALEPDSILFVGDLSYADGWQDVWDTFGRAFETVASKVPVLTTGGNHELQSGENWLPYYLRYPTPYSQSESPDPSYWGREVGPVHVIALNSYGDYLTQSAIQYRWFKNYLETRVNRERTPWLVVMTHVPFYTSNVVHWREGELMRRSMESLFYEHGVDILLNGHVHSYERTYPVYNNTLNECGTTHLILGDGGNYEGEATPWRNDAGTTGWSAFREASFGVGGLNVVNSTHAYFSWHRHACGSSSNKYYYQNFSSQTCMSPDDNSPMAMETSDELWIIRQDKTICPNKYQGSNYAPKPSSSSVTTNNNNNDDSKYSTSTTEALLALTIILGVVSISLLITVIYLLNRNKDPQNQKLVKESLV